MKDKNFDFDDDDNINFDRDEHNSNEYGQIEDDEPVLTGKDSNFVFFFGSSGSGKSVILASLLYYMRTKLGVFRPKKGTPNSIQAEVLLENFFEELRKGNLPARTMKDEVTRFDLVFDPNNRSKKTPEINLTFLEMSGENHNEIRKGGQFHKSIDLFLNAKVPLYFIVVAGYDSAREDDYLISTFFDRLEQYRQNLKSVNAILVISKWDISGSKSVSNPEYLNKFIANKLPMSSALFDKYKLAKTYFTIGNIEDVNEVQKLRTFNTYTPNILSNWLYKSITGVPINYEGTFWERLKWGLGM